MLLVDAESQYLSTCRAGYANDGYGSLPRCCRERVYCWFILVHMRGVICTMLKQAQGPLDEVQRAMTTRDLSGAGGREGEAQ
jgi:hypothetical protein